MFRLLRRFSIVCALAMSMAIAILAWLYWWSARHALLDISESNNVALGRTMANALAPLLGGLQGAGAVGGADPRVVQFGTAFAGLAAGLPVLKGKVIAPDGRVLYSSVAADIGEDESASPGFLLAHRGRPASELSFKGEVTAFSGVLFARHVVETYVPIPGPDGAARSVLELYVDVSDSVAGIHRTTANLVLILAAIFACVYGVLVVLVRRAEATIRGQYDELVSVQREFAEINRQLGYEVEERVQAEQALHLVNADLERRVAERTRELSQEIGERRRVEEELRAVQRNLIRQASFDALTGLPNRVLFRDRLNQVLNRARRDGEMAAVLFLDLDNFKSVNDTLGHAAGDKLLHAAAARLQTCVRGEDTVARLGGDEFTLVLQELESANDAAIVAEKILGAFRSSFDIDGHEIHVPASIGITLFPQDGDDPDSLLKNADAALYRAKGEGRNAFRFFTAEINEHAVTQLRLETNLRRALDREELSLLYQPIVDVETGRAVAVEALLRWNNAELGHVSPAAFVRTAEDKGLIAAIGEWVMLRACTTVKRWRDEGHGDLGLAVNVSSRQFRAARILSSVDRALNGSGLPPDCLELDLTESLLTEDESEVRQILAELAGRGIRLSIDDFGTGYSSLNTIKRFPFTSLKIDREFLRDVTRNAEDAKLARAIVDMAHTLGLVVIGEGVETEEQLLFLKAVSCDLAQGHLFCPPVDETGVTAYLASHCGPASVAG